MATLVMQSLGCEVAALNTVHFSKESANYLYWYCRGEIMLMLIPGNHTAYKQVKGTKTSAEEIRDIYEGLKQSYLTDFDVLLSGYAPNAGAVEAIGAIGRDLKLKASTTPGSFFWGLPNAEDLLSIGALTQSSVGPSDGRPGTPLRQRRCRSCIQKPSTRC